LPAKIFSTAEKKGFTAKRGSLSAANQNPSVIPQQCYLYLKVVFFFSNKQLNSYYKSNRAYAICG